MEAISYYESPLGSILLKSEDDALCGLWFLGQKHFPAEYAGVKATNSPPQILSETALWLDRYFSGENPDASSLILKPQGSNFSRQVWNVLLTIPYGKTITYGQIAKKLEAATGRRVSSQAVGSAVGRNPISIIIPCHRVVGANGSLTGYAGGMERKATLLEHEKGIKIPRIRRGT